MKVEENTLGGREQGPLQSEAASPSKKMSQHIVSLHHRAGESLLALAPSFVGDFLSEYRLRPDDLDLNVETMQPEGYEAYLEAEMLYVKHYQQW